MCVYNIYDDENNLIRNTNTQRTMANALTKSRVTATLTGAYTRVYISRLKYNELSLHERRGESSRTRRTRTRRGWRGTSLQEARNRSVSSSARAVEQSSFVS